MQWFQRLVDVPEVRYAGSPGVQRAQLPGYNATPTIQVDAVGGERHEAVTWRVAGSVSSASPCQRWHTPPQYGETPAQTILRQMYEQLELPGTLRDYHFALQTGHTQLWPHRSCETWVLTTIEQVCWIDMRLIEAYPEVLHFLGANQHVVTVRSSAYERLVTLYEQNGYLIEAFEVASRAPHLAADSTRLQALKTRLAQLEAEDGSSDASV